MTPARIATACVVAALVWSLVDFLADLQSLVGLSSTCGLSCTVVAAVALAALSAPHEAKSPSAGPSIAAGGDSASADARDEGLCEGVHRLHGVVDPGFPKDVLHKSNVPGALPFDCGRCYGEILILHKPTADPTAMAAGDYPYAQHIHARKRLWEIRWHLHFREAVEPGALRLGMEQDRYYWPGWLQQRLTMVFVGALKAVAGGAYHSRGDDPAVCEGEAERPIISFPVWLFDQILVTPEGQTPPDLHDPDFSSLGRTKSADRKAFREFIENLAFEPGPTYTVAVWCIAQYVDAIRWTLPGVRGLPETKMLDISVHPPSFFIMYTLKPDEDGRQGSGRKDDRHLDSRKITHFRMAVWSSLVPAPVSRQRELMMSESVEPQEDPKERNCCACCCQ